MDRFKLTIPGEPVPQERARKGKNGWYTPKATQEFQKRVRAAWMVEGRPRVEGPLNVSARFYVGRKPSHLKKLGGLRKGAPERPSCDIDNLLKGVLDALQDHNGERRAFENDSQVVCLSGIHKRYAPPGMEPWTDVDVWTVST